METLVRYAANSQALINGDRCQLSLAPNLNRPPVNLQARIKDVLPFRDGMLALRDCILSELYLSTQEIADRQNDPVITVTRDRVFFEAFSRDESSYARLALKPESLTDITALEPGCTNIDFSADLQRGLQQMRSTRPAYLEIQRQGVVVESGDRRVKEARIALPDSWVQGFLEVQSALRLPAVALTVHPQDLQNLLAYLKQRKTKISPRSLRFCLEPGQPPTVTVEPWNQVFVWQRSQHEAHTRTEIKVWGRRRLLLLEKILPHLQQVRVLLQGTGLPSFWIGDLGHFSFLLGLSAWTARDWTTTEQYHLFQPTAPLTPAQQQELQQFLHSKPSTLRAEIPLTLGWTEAQAIAGLNELCLQGRVLFDPETGQYFSRDLFPETPPAPAALSKREQDAATLVRQGKIAISHRQIQPDHEFLQAVVTGKGENYHLTAAIHSDGSLIGGSCECKFFARFSLQRGPCKHLIALREAAIAIGTKNLTEMS
jgi:hypothetical protein